MISLCVTARTRALSRGNSGTKGERSRSADRIQRGQSVREGQAMDGNLFLSSSSISAPPGVRQTKFTPERIRQIVNLVERGKSREEIAELVGVTLGTLQVTCSRFGISLRRPRFNTGTGYLRPSTERSSHGTPAPEADRTSPSNDGLHPQSTLPPPPAEALIITG